MRAMSTHLADQLEQLRVAHLIHAGHESEATYLFNHVLMQETTYGSLLMKGRRELHLEVASAFERAYAERLEEFVPTLAFHYWRGEQWSKAAEYAQRAGERALRMYALREAMGYYSQAIEALDKLPVANAESICDAILGWTQAAFGFEPFPKLLERLNRAEPLARQLGDKRRLARILHETGRVYVASGYAMQAAPALLECFALATQLGDERLAIIPTYYMGMATHTTEPREAVGWLNRAVELARRYADVDTEAYALSSKAMVEARLGNVDESRRDLAQAFQMVPRITSPMCDSDVHLFSAMAFLDLGDIDQGLEFAKLGVEKAVSADNMECACFAYACLGMGHLRAAQITEAVQAFEEAVRRSAISGAEEAQVMGEAGLGMARVSSGQPEGIQQIQNALAHADRIGEQNASALLEQTLGEINLQRGQAESAVSYLEKALAYYRRHQLRPYLTRTLELLAMAFDRQGQLDKAQQARDEITDLQREALQAA